VKSVGFLAVYSGIFLLVYRWLGGNNYLAWLVSVGLVVAVTVIATRRFFIIFPLRETVLSTSAKMYYPVVVIVSCVIMMIVLGITGVVTGLGQLLLAIAVYFLWAADYLHRAKSMAPEFVDS